MNEKAIKFLKQDSISNIDMLEALHRGIAKVLYAGEGGVQLQVHETIMQCAASLQAADWMTAMLPKQTSIFTAHEPYSREAFRKRFHAQDSFGKDYCCPCRFAVWTGKNPLPVSDKFSVHRLTMKYMDTVCRQYHLFDEPEYIAERLKAGAIFGAFCGKEMAGFIGEHAEGAMGLLEVYPKFRRMGVASALEADAVNRCLAAGNTAYGDIILGNDASFALQRSLGLQFSKQKHYWLTA